MLLVFAMLMAVSVVAAQEPITKTPAKNVHGDKKEKPELPVKSEYDRALKHYGNWKDKFNDADYWKSVTLKRVSDKKEFKVKDLPDFDRRGFFLSNLRRCTFEMKRLDGFWQKELKEYTENTPKQEGVPTTAELKVYIEKLTKLRKETAPILEKYAENFVKDYADKLTKEEGELLLKQIKDFHDEDKLIERKK